MTAQSVITQAPKIFLKAGVYQQGDFDLILTPNLIEGHNQWVSLLNTTSLTHAIAELSPLAPAGRISTTAEVWLRNMTRQEFARPTQKNTAITYFVPVALVNPEKEQEMGVAKGILGLIPEDGAVITEIFANKTGLVVGDTIWMDPISGQPTLAQEVARWVKRENGMNVAWKNMGEDYGKASVNSGVFGGVCRCPDGREYQVGDLGDGCRNLACWGGVAGECHDRSGPWSGGWVHCHPHSPVVGGEQGEGTDRILERFGFGPEEKKIDIGRVFEISDEKLNERA
jgi:hypothetical protein